jgi:predicted RNase H-like HicB family nuclease
MGFEYNSIERALLTTNISDTAYECSRDACLAMLLGGSGEPPSAPFMSNADEGPVQSLMDLTGCDAREAASALERCNANVSEAAELLFRDLEDLESEIAALRIADLETVRVSERAEAEARDAALAEEIEARERQALGNGACCTALASDAALAAELATEMHAEGAVASDAALTAELATEMHAEGAVASDAALAAELEVFARALQQQAMEVMQQQLYYMNMMMQQVQSAPPPTLSPQKTSGSHPPTSSANPAQKFCTWSFWPYP